MFLFSAAQVFVTYGISWAWLARVIVAMYGGIALSGVSSVALALTLPHESLHLAGCQYFLSLPLPVIAFALRARERRSLRAASVPGG